MTEWSKLLHQLNSFSQSLKDPVKLVHISGRHHPPPFKPGPLMNPKAAQAGDDRWQHPCLSSAPATSPLWRQLIGNTLVYSGRERRRLRGQRQRRSQTDEDGNYCEARFFGRRQRRTVAFVTKRRHWNKDICDNHHNGWIYYSARFSESRNTSVKCWNKIIGIGLRVYRRQANTIFLAPGEAAECVRKGLWLSSTVTGDKPQRLHQEKKALTYESDAEQSLSQII